jgi:hypothetical protein
MISIRTAADVYPAVEELIRRLEPHSTSNLAAILDHRMHKVAWTTGHELFDELRGVLTAALADDSVVFDLEARTQIEQLLVVIKDELSPAVGYETGGNRARS